MFVVQPGEIGLGENCFHQRIRILGGPSSGRMWASYLTLGHTSYSVPITATAAQVQSMLRTLPYLDSVVVTGAYPVWDVFAGANASLVELITIHARFDDGTNPEVVVELVNSRPLLYRLRPPNGIAEASVSPVVGRVDIGNIPERRTQVKASEWHWGKHLGRGLGVMQFDESEGADRIWDSNCATDSPEGITVARQELTLPLDSNLSGARSLLATHIGRTDAGVRLVAMLDMSGNNTSGRPAYLDVVTQQWRMIPGSSPWSSALPRTDIITYRGSVYIGWSQTNAHGYLIWNGDTAANASVVALSTTDNRKSIISWAEFDGKLYALRRDGTVIVTAVVNAGANDWETAFEYHGTGYAFAITAFRHGEQEMLHLVATDGIYAYLSTANMLRRRVPFHSRTLRQDDYYPLASAVAIWRGDMYVSVTGKELFRFDGTNLQDISPWSEDGLPENSIAFFRELSIHSLTPINYFLLANCNNPIRNGASTTISSPTTITVPTTWYTTVVINDTVTVNDTVYVNDISYDGHCVLGYNGSGWHTIVPLAAIEGQGCQSSILHDLLPRSRLEFAPGRYIQLRDDHAKHWLWPEQRYSTNTSTVITPWYDRDLSDIDKLAIFWRIGYKNCGNGRTIAPFFQINGVNDSTSSYSGENPSLFWKRAVRKDGTTTPIGGLASDPSSGVAIRFFVNESGTKTDGILFRSIRLRYDLKTDDPTSSPILEWSSVIHGAMFDELFVFPVTLDLVAPSTDGRSAERQRTDLLQTYRSKYLHPLYIENQDPIMVKMENLVFRNEAAGVVKDLHDSLIATFQLTMWTGSV